MISYHFSMYICIQFGLDWRKIPTFSVFGENLPLGRSAFARSFAWKSLGLQIARFRPKMAYNVRSLGASELGRGSLGFRSWVASSLGRRSFECQVARPLSPQVVGRSNVRSLGPYPLRSLGRNVLGRQVATFQVAASYASIGRSTSFMTIGRSPPLRQVFRPCLPFLGRLTLFSSRSHGLQTVRSRALGRQTLPSLGRLTG